MTVTESEFIISQNLDSKINQIDTEKEKNLYKEVQEVNNNLNYNNNNNNNNSNNNDKNVQRVIMQNNNIRGKSTTTTTTINVGGYNGGITNNQKKERPQFITTVKTGVFLDPPHEIAILLGLSKDTKTNSSKSSNNSLNSGENYRNFDKPLVMYSYSSRPKVLNNRNYHANCLRTKRFTDGGLSEIIRDDRRDANLPYGNIMFDRRVVRGCNFASYPVPTEGFETLAEKRREARRRALARKKAKGYCIQGRMGTPPPVGGRKHEPVQTERYLEEIYDRPLETEAACQTDLFLDRPPTPIYVPSKTGFDQETQIWPGELFDFDVEVTPILEVLVGKTVEQSLIEVLEEEEIADLRAQQRRFLELRAAEKAEEQRLEEEEKRLSDEKEKRMVEHAEALKLQKETEERVAAAMLSEGYIAELVPNVLEGLKDAGFLADEIKSDVDHQFMPWLMAEVKNELAKMISSRDILGEIIKEILETKAETYTSMGDYFAGEKMEENLGEQGEEIDGDVKSEKFEKTNSKM
ncbi:Flagellar Radial spoke protein, putative [Pediculus humanus corporis]|uniref:Flagellar Radial spoke protein, putative n=1 Tax=Pediculus humanus subsp. corporis TaxID=121224 RepID=E0W3K1_PEDHC|nr:Flagellar Radial spoke protein, putative [Pediculus humanus corporis]EEB20207.1 Flagellar Radial spoke protein, putative [Pediculus humanus corporis]